MVYAVVSPVVTAPHDSARSALRVLRPDGTPAGSAVLIADEFALTVGSVVAGLPDVSSPVALDVPGVGRLAAMVEHVGAAFSVLRIADQLPSGVQPAASTVGVEPGAAVWTAGFLMASPVFTVAGRVGNRAGPDNTYVEFEPVAEIPPALEGAGVYDADGSVVGILRTRLGGGPPTFLPIDEIVRHWAPMASIISGAPAAKRPPYSGFLTDQDDGDDLLGRTREIQAMAALLVARDTVPPLAVGLFGDWGSGKSFFITKLQREIRLITRASAAASRPTDMCAEVRQITFNAWHYMDANLWASMVSAIFDGLAEPRHGESKDEARQRWTRERTHLVAELETSQELLETAKARQKAAGDEAERLRGALAKAVAERRVQRDKLVRLKSVATIVRDDPAVAKALEHAKARFQLAADTDLARIRDDAGSLVRRFIRVWNLLQPAARRRLRAWFWTFGALAVLLCVGVPWVLARFAPSAVQVVAGLLAFVGPLAVGAQRVIGVLGRTLSGVETVADAAQEVERRAQEERSHEETAIVTDLERLGAAQATLEHAVLLAENRRDEAAAALREAAAGSRLTAFIHERSRSADYRSQLGIVAMIRRDFDKLAELLDRGVQESSPGLPVDRIVLYVDDLDRCPPARVVEVLQAIHLLLALPLFVVVVAVDQRWLFKALEPQFARAGAVDYLEKIFQVPYRLSPMTRDDFGRLVGHHLAAGQQGARPRSVAAPGSATLPFGIRGGGTSSGRPRSNPELPLSYVVRPPGLRLTDLELEFFTELAPLFQTPRAAKRLINLYRLIRASLPEEQLSSLTDNGDHRCILYLLAILVGRPDQADGYFEQIRASADQSPFQELVIPGVEPVLPAVTTVQAKEWAPVVERFSFRF